MNAGLVDKRPTITDADFGIGAAINHELCRTILGNRDMTDYRCFAQSDRSKNKPRIPYANIKS
jgi:hypothetical protein